MTRQIIVKDVDFSANAIEQGGGGGGTTTTLTPYKALNGYMVDKDTLKVVQHNRQAAYCYVVSAGDFIELWLTSASSPNGLWCRGGFFTSDPVLNSTATTWITNGPDGEHVTSGGYGSFTATQNGYIMLGGYTLNGNVSEFTLTVHKTA